ncbi:MAG TPA: response regulator [Verrucomicrobiae bacterium]|jgi:DNA-binding response OmpR family regulator|nr:response regulator [Verrucomicrobiae bacterium]
MPTRRPLPQEKRAEKILICDDESSLLRFLKQHFAGQGYRVDTAKSGHEFQRRAHRSRPDLIILDIVLPDGLGTDYYEKLLRSGFDSSVPVIFLSALAQGLPPRHGTQEGRFALFGKPFDLAKLRSEMRRLLSSVPPAARGRRVRKGRKRLVSSGLQRA